LARIHPFRGLRYDTRKAGKLENVVTQPYDKITPGMLERYHSLSPFNLSWIIKTTDYAGAARRLSERMAQDVLRREDAPCIYPYSQTYCLPGSQETRTRRGFIAAGALEPYEAGVVFRHEQTQSGPKQDRLALLRATRVHFGQLFMLYSDPQGSLARLLDLATESDPLQSVRDEYGVEHQVWRVDMPEWIERFVEGMAGKKLIIADGHHRYETALAFREECRASGRAATGAPACRDRVCPGTPGRDPGTPGREGAVPAGWGEPGALECQPPFDAVMMTFVNMDQPGLTILPTHRVLRQFPAFDRARFLESAARFFDVQPLPLERGRGALEARQAAGQAIGVALGGATDPEFVLLGLKAGVRLDHLLPGLSAAQRTLDVVVLHDLLLKECLNIGDDAVREEKFLEYAREFGQGLDAVRAGAPACFFLNPVRVEQVRDIALAGGVLPQKSTDFYPKMLSGLTGYEV